MCVIGYRIKDNNPRCWFSLVTYYFAGRLSPLPDEASSQADEWGKVLGQFTLQRRKKLSQTVTD